MIIQAYQISTNGTVGQSNISLNHDTLEAWLHKTPCIHLNNTCWIHQNKLFINLRSRYNLSLCWLVTQDNGTISPRATVMTNQLWTSILTVITCGGPNLLVANCNGAWCINTWNLNQWMFKLGTWLAHLHFYL